MVGAAAHAGGRFETAESAFRHLTRLQPTRAAHWLNLGTALRGLARYDDALRAYARAHELGGYSPAFCYNVGLTHLDRLDYESARAVLAHGVSLAPRDAAMCLQYANACFESGHTQEGVGALAGGPLLAELAPAQLADAGQRLQGAGEAALAAAAMSRLMALPDLDAQSSLTLVHMLERANRLDDAAQVLAALREGGGTAPGAELSSAEGRIAQRGGRHAQAIAHFERALALDESGQRRHYDLFPLARSLDAQGRADEAWARLGEAHRSQVAQVSLAAPLHALRGAPTFAIAGRGTEREDIAAWDAKGAPGVAASPVFIVAFPRSGTTLLEQVLDAHPDLASMDEQPFLQYALEELAAAGGRYPDRLAAVSPTDLDAIRGRYFERAQGKVALAPGQRLVDKNPLNLLRLPAIRRLFPNARVILAIRHPCDVLLSCHMQHFTAPEFALLCADLPTLAAGYRKAFDAWYREQALLQAAVHELRYESLVTAFGDEVRALADFLELPWHGRMLAPAEHARGKAYISTPSYAQVVQPVNARAVGRWHAYRRHFEPVLPVLAPLLARWGYEAG